MERENLYFVLFEQQKFFKEIKDLIEREITQKIVKLIPLKMPLVITGVRRCGKSSLFSILKDELKFNEKEFLYINFNDERLINFSVEDFQKILDYLEENNFKKNCTLFLDEIQEANGWEKWIDRIREKYTIFISGSNSKLLSKEISSILTGRSININLFPFSFKEFLIFKKIDLKNWKADLKIQSKIRKEFKSFLEGGGFPQRVITNQKIIISELYENILYRDIIKRFNKNMVKPIKEISLYLLSNITSDISLRKLSKMSGIKNIISIKEIINSFENAFLFFSTSKFDYSVKTQIQNPKKIYCIDNGFGTSLGFKFSSDMGKLLENLTAIELKRKNKEIYYWKNEKQQECDFIIKEKTKITRAIQVCHKLNNNSEAREIRGLIKVMEEFKLKRKNSNSKRV